MHYEVNVMGCVEMVYKSEMNSVMMEILMMEMGVVLIVPLNNQMSVHCEPIIVVNLLYVQIHLNHFHVHVYRDMRGIE